MTSSEWLNIIGGLAAVILWSAAWIIVAGAA